MIRRRRLYTLKIVFYTPWDKQKCRENWKIYTQLRTISPSPSLLFSGFLVDVNSVVSFLSCIKWISIFRYSNNIFAINEFVGLTLYNSTNHTDPIDRIQILKQQNIDYSTQWDLWKNFVALAGITLSFLILTYIQLFRMKKTK
jgi:ATP-binding cassette subfamily G (WHITE) protein 2